jgi:prepilin-type N-terminal cleavage/methylation domain-containing protein
MNTHASRGFTLLEIVIVVLIVGFLLAGVLKGQEMITGARVKRMAGQIDEIRAAYFGFEDRFRGLPGDYADAHQALTCPGVCLRGNGDSRIRADETPVNGSQVHEDLLVWSHLTASGFLKGDYRMADGESQPSDTNSPKNPYLIYLQISVLIELDRKVDDGKPYKGGLQFSTYQGSSAQSPTEGGPSACTTATDPDADWNLQSGNSNCGAATLL